MSHTPPISQNLVALRRFARALTGSQQSGDAYAVVTLEAIAAQDEVPNGPQAMKLLLFTTFLRTWLSMPLNRRPLDLAPTGATEAADRALGAITPLPRVAFLLRAMEDFSDDDIASMLSIPVGEVRELLESAAREITEQLTTDVLIIEDAPVIAMDLEDLVIGLGHRVSKVARTRAEAVQAIREHRPGLVLADIHLADGSSGLDAVNEILADHSLPVVFITAYPERLLTGRRPEPTFLVTKPFRREHVMAIISQALFFDLRASLRAA